MMQASNFIAFVGFCLLSAVFVAQSAAAANAASGVNDDLEEVITPKANKKSFGFSYKLFVPWNKYPWYNSLMDGQIVTNEAITDFLDTNLHDCERSHFGNNQCSMQDILQKGPCRRIEWIQFLCCCRGIDDDDDDDCESIPSRIFNFVEDDLKTQYPWSAWLKLEWIEDPEIIPNPKDDESTPS